MKEYDISNIVLIKIIFYFFSTLMVNNINFHFNLSLLSCSMFSMFKHFLNYCDLFLVSKIFN